MDGDGTPKDLRARLRRANRCFRCKKKGHWKAECPEKQHNKDGTAPAVFSELTFLHTVNEESVWSAATWSGQYDEDAAWATGSAGIPSGHSCVRWEQKLSSAGLCGVRVHCKMMTPKRCRRCSTSHKIDDDAYYDRRTCWGVAVHCGRRRHPGIVAIEFSGETGAMINLRTNKLHLPHLRAVVPMHRTPGCHRTIDVTTGLTPVTFRVPEEISHQFGLTWHHFVTGSTVENPIRDGNDQLVVKDETENMCRVTESIHTQHGKNSKLMVTIYHQDTIVGQDNDHLHLTDSHFSQKCDNASSLSHDTGSFSLSNTISTRTNDRLARLTLLLWSQREEDWRERVKSGKMVGTIEPSTCYATTPQTERIMIFLFLLQLYSFDAVYRGP